MAVTPMRRVAYFMQRVTSRIRIIQGHIFPRWVHLAHGVNIDVENYVLFPEVESVEHVLWIQYVAMCGFV